MNRTLADIPGKQDKKELVLYIALILVIGMLALSGLYIVGKFIGMAFHAGQAGYIYQINILQKQQSAYWMGVYGVAVRVPDYTNEIYYPASGGGMLEANLLFECLQPGIEHEVYASQVPSSSIDWATLQPATTTDVDDYVELSASAAASGTSTFQITQSYQVGSTTYNAPATFTYKEGELTPATFDLGVLKDGNGNLVFVTHIMNFTSGFNGRLYNYQLMIPVRFNTTPTYYFFTDRNDVCPEGEGQGASFGRVYGNVTTNAGIPVEGVIVEVAGYTTLTDANGFYNLSTREGEHNIYAIKTGYNVYKNNVTVIAGNETEHNIIMVLNAVPNPNTGPGQNDNTDVNPDIGPSEEDQTESNTDVGPGEAPLVPILEQPKLIEGKDYIISVKEINRKLLVGNFLQEIISFYSFKKTQATLTFSVSGDVADLIKLDKSGLVLNPNANDQLTLTIFGKGEPKLYTGNLTIDGDINETIPITIDLLSPDRLPVEALLIRLDPVKRTMFPGDTFKFETNLQNLLSDQEYPVALSFTAQDAAGDKTIWTDQANVYIKTSFSIIKGFKIPENTPPGDYVIRVSAHYLGLSGGSSTAFIISLPFYQYMVFGLLPLWKIALILAGMLLIIGILLYVKRNIESKKKYHLTVEYGELPQPGPKTIFVGKIAETDHKAYFQLNNFKTHTITAGATGGGKSFAAQGLVEEALLKNVCVFVFDPTAQWSGMLRKCTDKGILALYPPFGMKPTQAKAFNGNIRQITNPLEKVNIHKYLKPGEIQIFACNKMDPKDIDIFVANTIKEVFHSNFDESQDLRLLLVYDEVHRLLPKFGGSGEGFLQIERGCREFRKWGVGILLISQVLADFVGQIKANINTEIQMRTRDEGDLERIRVKYGEGVLQSLVKASVGTGMVENPAYNRGRPYFISFRPILHSVQRLSDEELEKYNKYNEIIDDLYYQLDQLEQEKLDVFDLRLELKLSLDKVKSGNFNMVDIYLEGLTPRIETQWKKIGKTPKKYTVELVSAAEIQEELKKAQAERAKFEAEQKKNDVQQQQETVQKKRLLFDKTLDFKQALNFKNGTTVLSLQELLDVLPNISPSIYVQHVSQNKHDVADWVEKNFSATLGQSIRAVKKNEEIVKLLQDAKDKKMEEESPTSPAPVAITSQDLKAEEMKAFQEMAQPVSQTPEKQQTADVPAAPDVPAVQQQEAATATSPAANVQEPVPVQASVQETPTVQADVQESASVQTSVQAPIIQAGVQEPTSVQETPAVQASVQELASVQTPVQQAPETAPQETVSPVQAVAPPASPQTGTVQEQTPSAPPVQQEVVAVPPASMPALALAESQQAQKSPPLPSPVQEPVVETVQQIPLPQVSTQELQATTPATPPAEESVPPATTEITTPIQAKVETTQLSPVQEVATAPPDIAVPTSPIQSEQQAAPVQEHQIVTPQIATTAEQQTTPVVQETTPQQEESGTSSVAQAPVPPVQQDSVQTPAPSSQAQTSQTLETITKSASYHVSTKAIPEDKYFYARDGKAMKTITDLKEELTVMPDDEFNHHVTQDRNDFANWIRDVFEDRELGDQLLRAHSRTDMRNILVAYGY
ncbi:MAG: DUF87 domain-containing protein [archaeon]